MVEEVMSSATASLPPDPDALRAFATALQEALVAKERELAARDAEIHAKTLHIEKLRATLALMKRARFGRSSERLEQLELLIGDLEEEAAEQQARQDAAVARRPSQSRERRPRGRQPLPAHLPRERVEHEARCVCPACGSRKLSRIGTDEREVLEYVPSHFKVVVHVRPKMSCRACETITQAPAPSLPIERGRPGPSLLAHVLVAKYADHLPLHRQSVIYGRAGVELERSTLADWVGQAAFLLEPLAAAITRHARAGVALHADDTPVPVLDPGRGKTKTGRLWVLVRDERPWAGPAPPAVSYLYSPDRKGAHAAPVLSRLPARRWVCRLQRPLRARCEWHGAARRGRMLGAQPQKSCSTCTPRPARPSPSKRWSGSPRCSRSKPGSTVTTPNGARPCVRSARYRCSPS
jgi:transposase